METFLLFLLAGAITLFFMRGKIKGIGDAGYAAGPESQQTVAANICSRCSKNLTNNQRSCPHCGESEAMGTA